MLLKLDLALHPKAFEDSLFGCIVDLLVFPRLMAKGNGANGEGVRFLDRMRC